MSFGKIHTQLYIGPPLRIFPIFDGTYVPVPNRIHCVRRLRDYSNYCGSNFQCLLIENQAAGWCALGLKA